MTYLLYLFTFLPAWFVGPLPTLDLPPGSPPVYYVGPSLVFPLEPTPDGVDRIVIIVDPPAPAPVVYPIALPPAPARADRGRELLEP